LLVLFCAGILFDSLADSAGVVKARAVVGDRMATRPAKDKANVSGATLDNKARAAVPVRRNFSRRLNNKVVAVLWGADVLRLAEETVSTDIEGSTATIGGARVAAFVLAADDGIAMSSAGGGARVAAFILAADDGITMSAADGGARVDELVLLADWGIPKLAAGGARLGELNLFAAASASFVTAVTGEETLLFLIAAALVSITTGESACGETSPTLFEVGELIVLFFAGELAAKGAAVGSTLVTVNAS